MNIPHVESIELMFVVVFGDFCRFKHVLPPLLLLLWDEVMPDVYLTLCLYDRWLRKTVWKIHNLAGVRSCNKVLGRLGADGLNNWTLWEKSTRSLASHSILHSFLFNLMSHCLLLQRLLTSPTIPTSTTIAKKLSTYFIIWLCFLNYAR